MTEQIHTDSFVIERMISKCPEHVFSAWSDPEKKRKWFASAKDNDGYVFDFRIGGREYGAFENEMGLHENETRYFEIIDNALIIFAYSMSMNKRIHTVSLVTVTFEDHGGGTKLIYTEQMSVHPPSDGAEGRVHGWQTLLDGMENVLEAEMV